MTDTRTEDIEQTVDTEEVFEIDNDSKEIENTDNDTDPTIEVDYEKVIEDDLASLRSEFHELANVVSITELNNPLRYAALRDLGLSPAEAYLATRKRTPSDTRAHLGTAYAKRAASPYGSMPQRELTAARELFGDLNDADIQRLYRKVTK